MTTANKYMVPLITAAITSAGFFLWSTFSTGADVKFKNQVAEALVCKMNDQEFVDQLVKSPVFIMAVLKSPIVLTYMDDESKKITSKIETKIYAQLSIRDSIEIVASMRQAKTLGIRDEQLRLLQEELLEAYKDGKLKDKPTKYREQMREQKVRERLNL